MQYSDEGMSYTYVIVDSPLPVADYVSTLAVMGSGGGSMITWSGEFAAEGAPDAKAVEVISGIYQAGLAALKERLRRTALPQRTAFGSERLMRPQRRLQRPCDLEPLGHGQERADHQMIAVRAQHQLAVVARRIVERDPHPVGLKAPFALLAVGLDPAHGQARS